MIALITGGRDYEPAKHDGPPQLALALLRECRVTEIVQGGAHGADEWARLIAHGGAWKCTEFQADWSAHGKAAGPIRNQQMVDYVKERGGFVIAFPGGRGTADCVGRARAAGLEVVEICRNQS